MDRDGAYGERYKEPGAVSECVRNAVDKSRYPD